MKNVDVKKVLLTDIDPLQKISRQTFSETFSAMDTEENMRKYSEKN